MTPPTPSRASERVEQHGSALPAMRAHLDALPADAALWTLRVLLRETAKRAGKRVCAHRGCDEVFERPAWAPNQVHCSLRCSYRERDARRADRRKARRVA